VNLSGVAPHPPTLGVVLAGGLARRMGGGDKPLLSLGGSTLLEHAAKRLAPQCASLILNANGDPSRFEATGLSVVPDSLPDHAGPLAGILTALEWAAAHRPDLSWVVSIPGDTPFIPKDLVSRLHEEREAAGQPVACAASGKEVHYAVGLWPVHLRQDLRQAVTGHNMRRIRDWVGCHGYAKASWPAEPVDPFFNINTPGDLARAEALVRLESVS
jgi:molybdenum cofactor guanylyltransferase